MELPELKKIAKSMGYRLVLLPQKAEELRNKKQGKVEVPVVVPVVAKPVEVVEEPKVARKEISAHTMKIRLLASRLRDARDRRNWETCKRLEKELAELEGL